MIIAQPKFKYYERYTPYKKSNADRKGRIYKNTAGTADRVTLCIFENDNMYGIGYYDVPAGGIIGIGTINYIRFSSSGDLKKLFVEIEVPSKYDNRGLVYYIDLNTTRLELTLSETSNAVNQISTIIANNLAIHDNNVLCSRIITAIGSQSDKDVLARLQRSLFLRDRHFRSTVFLVQNELSTSGLAIYESYLTQIMSAGSVYGGLESIPTDNEYVSEFDFDIYHAPAGFVPGVNPASAIINILFAGDYSDSMDDLKKSTEFLLDLSKRDINIINAMRSELKNVVDIYALNKKLGYTPPDVPAAISITQPTFENKSGTIIIYEQPGCEYSIDGRNYQRTNIFGNLVPGTYSLYVRRSNDILSIEKSDVAVTINSVPVTPETTTPEPTTTTEETSTGGKLLLIGGSILAAIKLIF